MKEKIFKWLFKKEYDKIKEPKKKKPTPTMADLMRDNLHLPMIDFANVDEEGYPPHFLDNLTKEERLLWNAELSKMYQSKELNAVFDYWLNMFGNHAIRKGDDSASRFSINGLAMIRKTLEKSHREHQEALKPPDDFDKFSPLPE